LIGGNSSAFSDFGSFGGRGVMVFMANGQRNPMSLGMGGIEGWIVVWDSSVIGVSVGPADTPAVAMRNPLDGPFMGLNVKRARSADSYSAGIDAAFVTFRDDRFNQIAGPESPDGFGPRHVAAGESIFSDPRPLIRTAAGRFDIKDRHCPGFEFIDAADASRVQSMGFWNRQFHSVKFGQASGEGSGRESGFTELSDYTISGRINDRA
jgi:hypothetical protein